MSQAHLQSLSVHVASVGTVGLYLVKNLDHEVGPLSLDDENFLILCSLPFSLSLSLSPQGET